MFIGTTASVEKLASNLPGMGEQGSDGDFGFPNNAQLHALVCERQHCVEVARCKLVRWFSRDALRRQLDMASILLRAHYKTLSIPVVGSVYRHTLALKSSIDTWWEIARFVLGARWQGAETSLERTARTQFGLQKDTGEHVPVRMLVHIAFHLNRARLRYVRDVIERLLSIPVAEMHIVLDTNSQATQRWLSRYKDKITTRVHETLEHPFLLTWACRPSMKEQVDRYDLFAYLEDDMLLVPQALRMWLTERERLGAHGFIPGFLRVEFDRQEQLVASDFLAPASASDILYIEGAPYLATEYAYQACWLYDQPLMKELVASAAFPSPDARRAETDDVRAIAALGLTFENPPSGRPSRLLLPLTADLAVKPEAFVYHLPSNYGRQIGKVPGQLASVRVRDLIRTVT